MRLQVKVKARARKSEVTGWLGEALKLNIAATPVEGRANLEVIRFLAELAGVPRSRVSIVTGETHPLKVVEIEGVERETFIGRFQ